MDYVFEKRGWHVSLWDAVKGLTLEQAAWMPSLQRNSIWAIVNHVALWKEDGARRIVGSPRRTAADYAGVDWQPIPEATTEAWQVALRRLHDAHTQTKAAIAKHGDVMLNLVPGLVAHDSYHCGQICYLRALQGIPLTAW